MVVKRWLFRELPMSDSTTQSIEAAATKNMDMGIEFYNHDLPPFKVDDDNGENVESSSTYREIPAEMPGVSIKTNIPVTPIHVESDLLDYFPEATIAAADSAVLEDPWLASADPGVVVTDAESDDVYMMVDANSFTWCANYRDPGLEEDHRSALQYKNKTQNKIKMKLKRPYEIDEYNVPKTS